MHLGAPLGREGDHIDRAFPEPDDRHPLAVEQAQIGHVLFGDDLPLEALAPRQGDVHLLMRIVPRRDDDEIENLRLRSLGRRHLDVPVTVALGERRDIVFEADIEAVVGGGGMDVAQHLIGGRMLVVLERPVEIGIVVVVADVLQADIGIGARPHAPDAVAALVDDHLVTEFHQGFGGGDTGNPGSDNSDVHPQTLAVFVPLRLAV